MKKSDFLHQLIHSLDRSEKRYFKVFSAQQKGKGAKNYLKVYEAMENMQEWSAEELLNALSGEPFVPYLSSEKNYLWKTLLKAMRSYHESQFSEIRTHDQFLEARILESKGLYLAAMKQLDKALKGARQLNQLALELIILNRKINLVHFLKDRNRENLLEQLLAEKEQGLARMQKSERVHDLYHRYMGMTRSASRQSKDQESELAKRIRKEIGHLTPAELTLQAQIHRQSLFFLMERSERDMKAAFSHQQQVVTLWESTTASRKQFPEHYKKDLANLLGAAFFVNRFDIFEQTLDKIRKLPDASFDQEAEMFQNVFFYELVWKMNVGKWDEAQQLVPEIELGLEKFAVKINKARELGFYYNICILFFFQSQWQAALKWARKLTQDLPSDHRQDLQQFGRLLELIIHCELDNFALLEYRIPAAKRFLQKRGSLMQFDQLVFRLLNELLNFPEKQSSVAFWSTYLTELESWQATLSGHPPVGVMETQYWIRSKVMQVPLKELIAASEES